MVIMGYIISSLRQHRRLAAFLLSILLINNYILIVFFGEFVRTDTQDWGLVQVRSESNMPFLLEQKAFDQILALYEKYEYAFSGLCRVSVEAAEVEDEEAAQIDFGSRKYMIAGYDAVKRSDANYSKDELLEGKFVVKTKWANTGENYTAFGHTFYAYHHDSKMDIVPMQEIIQLKLPVYFVSCFCEGGSVNEVAGFAKELQLIYPDAVIDCSSLDGRAQKEQKKILLFVVIAVLAVANIVFVYEYILQERKREIQIFRMLGSSTVSAMRMLFMEVQLYYIVSFFGADILYRHSYPLLYQWGITSYKARMEMSYLAGVFCLIDIVLLLLFGVFIIRFFWKRSLLENLH